MINSPHRRLWRHQGVAAGLLVTSVLTLSAATVPLAPHARAEEPTTINEHDLTADEATNLAWVSRQAYERLPGDREAKLDLLATSTWWTLKEGVMGAEPDEFRNFNNCEIDGNNVHFKDPNQQCGPGVTWQVGPAAVQVPNHSLETVESVAAEAYGNADTALAETLSEAGHEPGTAIREAAVADRGDVRKMWLLRNPAVGSQLVARDATPCFSESAEWCFAAGSRTQWDRQTVFAPNHDESVAVRAELRAHIAALTADADNDAPQDQDQHVTAKVWDLGGVALNVRAEATPDSASVGQLSTGDEVMISCQTEGPSVTNDVAGVTSTLWDYLPAHGGYVADAWVHTGVDGYVAPKCGAEGEPTDPPANGQECTARPYPEGSSAAEVRQLIKENHGLTFADAKYSWSDPVAAPTLRAFWEGLEKVSCTAFAEHVSEAAGSGFAVVADENAGGVWGHYREDGLLHIDVDQIGEQSPETLAWLVIHELSHPWSAQRDATYSSYLALAEQQGPLTPYGRVALDQSIAAGDGPDWNENFADMVAHYVARCSGLQMHTELSNDQRNPYDSGRYDAYYAWTAEHVFGGVEFGPAPGEQPSC